MEVTVRVARTEQDWEQALAVIRSVYVGEGYTPADRAESFMRREVLEPEGEMLMAVRADGAVIGATLFLHEGSRHHQVAMPGEREFRILAVLPKARGSGAGWALVHACMEHAVADDALGLVLWTRPNMLAAQRLYERLGFVREPERDEDDPRGFKRLVYCRVFF
ncbi:MAG TPA: GNAT family N-acetyltransferase [Flavobacteriales bacterium]|nr:GNAT family N-acetyltransferase [Flavobacteriales bacterium]